MIRDYKKDFCARLTKYGLATAQAMIALATATILRFARFHATLGNLTRATITKVTKALLIFAMGGAF